MRGFQEAAQYFYDKKFRELNRDEYLSILAMLSDPEKYHIQGEALANIERNAKNKQLAYENIIWALLNTKEFILVQ